MQREVGLGSVVVKKIEGPKNPADLMRKYFKRWEIDLRLRSMGIRVEWEEDDQLSVEKLTAEVTLLGWSPVHRRHQRETPSNVVSRSNVDWPWVTS